MQMDNDPNRATNATQELLKEKKGNILGWLSCSLDLNPIEHALQLLNTKLKVERPTSKQQLKVAEVSISRDTAFGNVTSGSD